MAFCMGLVYVHVVAEFGEEGQNPGRCCDMPGAVLHGLRERVLRNTFSFTESEETITQACESFLADVITFAKHCLSKKRVKNVESYLHPMELDPHPSNVAQVWDVERLAISVFVSVAPYPLRPVHTVLNSSRRLTAWDQRMLIGVDGGGFARSTAGDFNILKTLSKYLSSPTKTI